MCATTRYVRGPLNAPVVEIAPILSGVFRVTDGVLNIGKSGLGAGISIAGGGVNVAKEMGTGALNVGKKLLGGLFDTGKGLATLDAKQVEKGLVGSTVGTIDLSLDAVGGAGSAAGGGVDKSVSDLTGSAAVKAWDKGIPTRYQTAMQRGRKGPGENALSAGDPMRTRILSRCNLEPEGGRPHENNRSQPI
jgi:hypothetical protein